MEYPKISIITPNFNGEKYLEETIKSVLSQNYPNIEYIIIDGGSTDGSVAIIRKYESQLAYWVSESDKGLYEAIQKGFDKSTGDVMAWINSDDMYHNKAFYTVAEIFKHKDIKWLQGIPTVFDEKGRTVYVESLRRWSKLDYYLGNFKWIQQESVFWRRSLWEASGSKMDVSMKYAGDLDLWLRFFRHEKLYVTHALLGGFRQRSSGQLSAEFLNDYLEEAKTRIRHEVENNIPIRESILIKEIADYNKIISKIPYKFLKRIVHKYFHHKTKMGIKLFFDYAPKISFDRIKQEFKIHI